MLHRRAVLDFSSSRMMRRSVSSNLGRFENAGERDYPLAKATILCQGVSSLVSRTIELPDELYRNLEDAARESGLTPEGWIAATLAANSGSVENRPLYESLQDLLGVIDSAEEPRSGRPRTPLGELIAAKLESQGLRRP